MQRGNQHGGHEYDDLQNWFDVTSHENRLLTRDVMNNEFVAKGLHE